MAYILYKSNGQKLATIADGSIDKTTTDLTFVGKNYAGYGEILNQDLVKLLENFSASAEPSHPLVGQLWYDTASKNIKIYDGTRFKGLQSFDVTSGTRPTDNNKGDLWYNEFEQKLYFYNGTRFVLIGPNESQFSGITLTPTIALSDNELEKPIMKFIISDELDRVVVATVSRDDFTPNSIDDLTIENFTGIKKGITLPGSNSITGDSTAAGFYFWGTAGHALNLGDYPAEDYFRRSEFTEALNRGLHVNNDYGLFLGYGNVLQISADTGNQEAIFTGISANRLTFKLQYNSQTTEIFQVYENNIVPNSAISVNLGKTDSRFANLFVNTATITNLVATNIQGTVTGATSGTHTGNLIGDIYASDGSTRILDNGTGANAVFTGNVTGNVTGSVKGNITSQLIQADPTGSTLAQGTITGKWSLSPGSTLKATYADIAERYEADAIYEPGTVLIIGGTKEVTTTDIPAHASVAGIVSTNPAYMMNYEAGNDETHPYIALKGRVPCKVVGRVNKGDLLVTSRHHGYAEVFDGAGHPHAIIGKALGNHTGSGYGVVEVKV